jgi:hypothetical protein
MRLLTFDGQGKLSLAEFTATNIPPYAILSHTWGQDDEEVSFKDLVDGDYEKKAGYSKVLFCGEQAASDDLKYFWVDTCSIDKSSSAELSEAINSMLQWYREASKCYVYLSDVSIHDNFDPKNPSSESTFWNCRWFSRGWTLQELIAPASVEFFSKEGQKLGDKRSLEHQIHQITGISIQALRGCPLSIFSVEERMSWAAGRKATRKEDEAYCLLGIFNIYMPLIYGEGSNAMTRLRRKIHKALRDKPLSQPYRGNLDQGGINESRNSTKNKQKDTASGEHPSLIGRKIYCKSLR